MQAKEFAKVCSGDGHCADKAGQQGKGGAVFAIKDELGVPVRFVGVGEGIDDLRRLMRKSLRIPLSTEGKTMEWIA